MSPPGPRVLLVKLSSLGDVIHALPTLEALRTLYPQGHLSWLVEEPQAPLLTGHPALDEVLAVPRLRSLRQRGTAGLRRLWRTLRRLRREPFDLVIDLQGLAKSALWVALSRSPRKIGYDRTREFSYLALTERLPPSGAEVHAVERCLNVARYLGAPATPPVFRLGLLREAEAGFPGLPLNPRPLVVLHPGARWPTKLWPGRHWARLADWLADTCGCQVVITGTAGDRVLAAEIQTRARARLVNLAGATTLAQLAALLNHARLAITPDTGPMHLAAALGTPVVALFGPTAPWRTGPYGKGHEVVRLGLPCSPCFRRHCPEPRCLTELPVAAVQGAAEKILLAGKHS